MKRMHHVNGTKERPRRRECLTFRFANDGPVLIDRIHPEDKSEMFSRLWAHYGPQSVWATYRTMRPDEEYIQLESNEAA